MGSLGPDPSHAVLPKINSDRLWDNIISTASIGAYTEIPGGMQRLSLSDSDGEIRRWFTKEAEALGCEVKVDMSGNMFAVWNGPNVTDRNATPIGMGSHLDTQPMGGRFDGILGVLSALEIIHALRDQGISPSRPLVAINWTNEEGARFPAMCTGSSVWAGTKTQEGLHDLASLTEEGITMKHELSRLGFLGTIPSSYKSIPLAAHFELHIEQAKRLERESKRVGIVTGIQGMRWYTVIIHGSEGHAGSTPMSDRSDALVAASKLVLEVESEAKRIAGFYGTVGFLKPRSESTNTIVGEVRLTIDLRHPSEAVLDKVETNLRQYLQALGTENPGISADFKRTWESEAAVFDEQAVDCVREAAASVAGKGNSISMISCAGHDSAETSRVVPTAMIFVPSKDGISHAPAEYTSKEQCADGAQTLLEAVLAYDRRLATAATAARV